MPEECLLSIINAADPDDDDDITTRSLLVLMLRESGLGLAGLIREGSAPPAGHDGFSASPAHGGRGARRADSTPRTALGAISKLRVSNRRITARPR